MPLVGAITNEALQRVARGSPARLAVPALVPAMELLRTDTAHRTVGRSRRETLLPRSPNGNLKKPSPDTPRASGRVSRFKVPHC
uniref:Uncharacterized protein n=1 Tax=Arundo donax TaxID=35708 RepID=A0A0A9CJE3_ARUDO